MATPIKETPVLCGKDASRFLREVARNERRDHSREFERAMESSKRFVWLDGATQNRRRE